MRKISVTLSALALAAGLAAVTPASADEYVSNHNNENYAVATQSAAEAHETIPAAASGTLNYAPTPKGAAVNAIFPLHAPAAPSGDALFLQQGDRGIGNN